MRKAIRRGDLFYADLNPVVGSEQGGIRPVLVIQNDVGNHFSPTVVAAAITSRKAKNSLPTHILLENVPGLAPTSLLLLEQLRTIDRKRLRGYIGRISKEKMLESCKQKSSPEMKKAPQFSQSKNGYSKADRRRIPSPTWIE